MMKNSFIKTALGLVLAFAMTFAPIMSSYAVIVTAFTGDPSSGITESTEADTDISEESEEQSYVEPDGADASVPEEQETEEEVVPEDPANTDTDADEDIKADPDSAQEIADLSETVTQEEAADPEEQQQEEEEPEATKTDYVYQGNGLKVTAVLDDPEAIPDDAKLIVKPISKGSSQYDYNAYMDALNRGSDLSYDENNTLLYDIAFIKDGIELEPTTGKVSVTFEFLDSQLSDSLGAKKASDVNIIHLPLTDTVKEKYDTTADAKKISADDIIVEELTKSENSLAVSVKNEKVKFETSDFSVFAYTVDFEYTDVDTGKVYTFNLEGASSITIKELVVILGITSKDNADDFIGNVEDVKFSNEDLVKVEKTNKGWILKSLAPFSSEELLTITMKDGTVIQVKVTDVQESTELTNFLYNAVVSGATQNSDGKYVVEQGKDYSIILSFAENSSYQFANDQTLTYKIPEGIEVLTEQSGPFRINIVYKGKTYQVDARYELDRDGNLKIKFDETDPEYERLCESTNVSFRFTYHASFDGSVTEIKFSADVERDIVFDDTGSGEAYAEKSASYDETTGKFTYTIKVTANGDVTDVNVKDTISGDALIFNNDVQVSGNSSNYTINSSSNGFDYTFDSMRDGEVITITYTANVDFSKDGNNDGKISADQTKNTVTVKPDEGEPHTSEYSREINFLYTVKKDGTEAGTTTQGDKIINWEIEYNPLALVAVGGNKITDSISATSATYMKYYGNGITIKAYDQSGNQAYSRTVSYEDLTAHSDQSWTYTIPREDTTPYRYVITYQTVVDMKKVNGGGVPVTLDNTANNDGGTIEIAPENAIAVKKDVESYTTEEVTWNTTLSIPQDGLDRAIVTDYLPRIYLDEGNFFDILKDGSLEITGLLPGENYEVSYNAGTVVITFYKDADKTPGLQGHPGGRNVNVKLTTMVNQQWLEIGYEVTKEEDKYKQNHTNTINLNGVQDTAQVVFGKPGIEKTGKTEDGKSFNYTLTIKGLESDTLSVKDTFDTSLLEIDISKVGNENHMYMYGGNQWYQGSGKTPVSYTDTEDGMVLTVNSVPKDANGNYYPYYRISYYLKLKDGVDLEQLAIANGGEYDLTNKAIWAGHETEYTYKTKYNYLDKKLLNEGELGGTDRTAQYQITFNKGKATLNGGEPMPMTDVLSSNLSIDYGSINITTDPPGIDVPYSLSGGKDEDGKPDGTTVATYIVPDSTKVVITYTAQVRGNGSQKIVNRVSVKDENIDVENTNDYGSASEGDGAVASFKIVKVDGYDANKKLAGVKFKIFAENPGLDFGENADHAKEIVLETDENGEIAFDGEDYDFYFEEVYHVQEVETPENYGRIGFDYLVTLTNKMSHVDYGHYIYYYDDSMQIKNWPLEGLVVEKQVDSDAAADKTRYYNFRISILNADGTVNTDYNEKNGDDQFENGVTEFKIKDGEQHMLWGFLKGTKYKVEELDAEGFATTVTYSIFDEEGHVTETKTEAGTSHSGVLTQEDEVIIFRNSKHGKGGLKIRKVVTENGAAPTSNTISKLAGTYEFTIYNKEECTQDDAVGTLSLTVPDSGEPVTSEEIENLPAGKYWIKESNPSDDDVFAVLNPVEVTVESGKTGDKAVIATVTNNINTGSYEATTSYSGKKKWVNDNPSHRPSSIDIVLLADGKATSYTPKWNKEGDQWTYTFENLPVFNEDGSVIMYSVSEPDLPDNYTCTASTTTTSYTLGDPVVQVIHPCNILDYDMSGEYDLGFIIIKSTGRHDHKFIIWTLRQISDDEKTKLNTLAEKTFHDFDSGQCLYLSGVPMNYDHGSITARLLDDELITLTFNKPSDWAQFAYGYYKATYDPGTTELTNKYQTGGLKVVKTAQLNGVTDPAAAGKKFSVALFSDASGTNKIGDNKEITIGNDGTGEVTFDGLTVGTTYYVFEMDGDEKAGEKIGEYTVVNGSGSAVATVAIDNTVNLVNNKKIGDLKVSKTLKGNATDPSKEFHFEITVDGASGTYEATGPVRSVTFTNEKATVTLKGGESITIKGLPDRAAYTVEETDADRDGYSTSSEGASGTISADKTGDATPEAAFTNTKNRGGLTITKTFAGNTEKLSEEDKNMISFKVTGPEWDKPQTFTYAEMDNGVKIYSDITLGVYTVTENTGTGKTYTTTYKVGSEGTETTGTTATAEVGTEGITVAFTNTYQETEITLDADKFIVAEEGVTVPEKRFEFLILAGQVLVPGESTVPMPEDTTASITGAGRVSTGNDPFGPVSYTKTGTYTYTITETTASGSGWTCNTGGDVTATVTVTADENGALRASAEYGRSNDAGNAAKITNKYETGGLKVVKTAQLNGVTDPTAEGKIFTVALFSDASGTNKVGDSKDITIGSDGTGEVTFDGLTVGTTYYVFEMDGDEKAGEKIGEYTVVTGSGSAEATVEISNKVELVNNKKTGFLKVSKTLEGNATDPAKEFHFNITVAGATGTYEATGTVRSVTFTNEKATVVLKGGESVTIKGLPDGAKYTVTEQEKDQDGYTTSSEGASGTISADRTGDATPEAAFTNTRNKGGLTITKTFAGNTDKLTEEDKNKISFTVSGPEWSKPQKFTYADMESGVKIFEKIELGEYTVTESTGTGKTYTTTYKVGSGGTEKTGTTATAEVGTEGITVAFTNTYQETEITLDADKFIEADEGVTVPVTKFSFKMSAGKVLEPGEKTVPMPEDTTASITGAGRVSTGDDPFGEIIYRKTGKYTYIITETTSSGDGWTCNTGGDVTATVTVTADENGALKSSVVYDKTNTDGDAAKITNRYAASGSGEIKVKKNLTGRDWTYNDSFTFSISAAEGTPMPASGYITIRKGDKDQTKSFGEIVFTKAGEYTYTIKEAKGSLDGVTYDTTDHNVTIRVKDDGKGHLVADGCDLIQTEEFTNTYTASPAKGDIRVQKVLKGRKWTDDDEFEFTVTGEAGAPMPANTSIYITRDDKDQTKSFGEITFTKPGKYTYTVEEVEGDDDDITYDSKAHKVTIEIVDDGNGNLIAKKGTSTIKKVKITNTYNPEKTVKTGDDSNMIIYLAGMIAAMLGLIAMIVCRRTQRNQ